MRKALLIIYILVFTGSFMAQSGGPSGASNDFLPKITPPSPEAFKLGNYGNVPIGLFTGSMNLDIPLHTFSSKNLSQPIGIFYSSNGIKVDDTSGNAGLGWALNFGGIINRTVRDLPDEDGNYLSPPNVVSGGLSSAITNTFLYQGGDDDLKDTEADNFSFSCNGMSGKFILDENRNVLLESKMNLKFQVLPYDQGFVVTDTHGIKYYFTETEKTMFRTSGSGSVPSIPYVTAWYLSKIEHPKSDIIYFTYGSSSRSMVTSQSQNFYYTPSQASCNGGSYGGGSSFGVPVNQNMTVYGKRIESIKSNNPTDGFVTFSYDSTANGNQDETNVQAISEIIKYDGSGNVIEKNSFNYLKTPNKRLFLISVKFKDPNKGYNFEYITPENFPERLSHSQDHWGYYNGQSNANLFPQYNEGMFYNNTILQQQGANKEPYENFAKIGLLRKIIYPTKGVSEFTFGANSDDSGKKGGGVRVESASDYDIMNGPSSSNYRKFYHSSGDVGNKPLYYSIKTTRINCSEPADSGGTQGVLCNYKDVIDYVLTSSSMISLFDSGSSSTFYGNVTISYGGDQFEKGKETKEFIINRNILGHLVYGSNDIVSSPFTNLGWDNGLEIKNEVFANNNNSLGILKSVINEYEAKNISERRYYTFRKNFDLVCSYDFQHTCTQEEVSNYPPNPCYGKAVGTNVILRDISNIDAMEYKNISNQHYLKFQKTTDYLNGNPVVSSTRYFYESPSHYQLTQEENTTPEGIVLKKSYQYAYEKGNQLMIDRNMVGIPLETTATQTIGGVAKTLSKMGTIYPTSVPTAQTGNLVLPVSVLSYDLQNPATGSTEVTYDKYDIQGNLQQYTTKDGIPVTIIWGYNQTQPIAKIEGAKLSDIPQSLIDNIVSTSNTDASAAPNNDETALLSALDTFRKDSSFYSYQITTYTYDPLIGVRSITPPSGIREVYQYDSANRLEKIVDVNGKLLKEFKYNYKN